MAVEVDWECPNIFDKYRMDIVQCIDTDKQFMFSYLRSNSILDEEDCERINHGITRQEKVAKMLDILSLKGPDATNHFVKAVEFEHPKLFEKMTGKKADSNLSYESADSKNEMWKGNLGLDGKALIDFDREFLAKQLDRAMTDLKCMTYWQSKILKEKNNLEQKLFEATDDLQTKDKNMNDLQEKIIQFTAEKRAEATEEDSLQTDQPMQLYLQELWRDNMERSNVIIALQGRLLVANEQVEELRKSNAQLVSKNEDFKNQVRNLTIVYDHERRNSRKLNETMMSQTTEADVLKKEILKMKYEYNCLLEEKDFLQTELEDFQKWVEILNAKFDIVTQEKVELEENSEDLCSRFRSLQINNEKLEAKLKLMEFTSKRFSVEGDRLKSTIESLRKNRNNLNAAREAAISSRNEAVKERAKTENNLKEMQMRHDQDMEEQIRSYEELENKHCQLLKDIEDLNQQLTEKENEIQEIKNSFHNHRPSVVEDDTVDENSNKEIEVQENDEMENDQSEASSTGTTLDSSFFKDKRSHRDLIDSIRRKVSSNNQSKSIKGNSLPSDYKSAAQKGYLDYEQLSLIYSQQLNQPVTKMLSTQGLHLNITDAMVNKNYSLPNMKRASPFSISAFSTSPFGVSPTMFDKSFTDKQMSLANQPKYYRENAFERRQTLQKTKAFSADITEPFRDRLYCMDPKGTIIDKRTRSVSSPPQIYNNISVDGGKKAAST